MLCHSHVQHGRRQESHPKEGRVTWKVKERAQDPKAPKKGAETGGVVFAESLVARAAPYPRRLKAERRQQLACTQP